MSGVSTSLLKNIKYLQRRMATQRGTVAVERHVLGVDSGALLETLATIEARSWVALDGGDLKFSGDRNQRFWRALYQGERRRSEVVAWTLTCRAQPVAYSAHIESGDTIYIIANGYDEEWKSFSPGSILSLELLTDACRRGLHRVDWGQGDSGYKSRWGAQSSTRLLDFLLFHPGLRGRLAFALAQKALPASWQIDRTRSGVRTPAS